MSYFGNILLFIIKVYFNEIGDFLLDLLATLCFAQDDDKKVWILKLYLIDKRSSNF